MTFWVAGMTGAQKLTVGLGNFLAGGKFFVQNGQFGQEDGGLQRVQAAVDPNAHMVVTTVLTMASNLAHHFGQFVVVGKDGATIAVAAQWFTRKKTGTANGAEVAAFSTFISSTKALGSILNHRQVAVFGRDDVDSVHVGGLAI